jgi:hypothetical protein
MSPIEISGNVNIKGLSDFWETESFNHHLVIFKPLNEDILFLIMGFLSYHRMFLCNLYIGSVRFGHVNRIIPT